MSETSQTEYKSSFNDAVIETLTAFTNSKGGRVFIGVDNHGEPVRHFSIGEESLQKWVNEVKNKTQPSLIPEIEVDKRNGHPIVVMTIHEFPIKTVAFKGRYYKRIQNSNHLLSIAEISDLHLSSLQSSWDAYEHPGASLNELDEHKIARFISRVNQGGRFYLEEEPHAALEKMRLLKKGQPTQAAMLLFPKIAPPYQVHVGRLKTPSHIIDDKIIRGDLFEVVEETMRYIIGQIKVAFEITGETTQRNEIFEYPVPALRELVLNAIVHRDYSSPVDVQIKIFDNRISIYNPGKLYGQLTIEELHTDQYQSQTRNKLIAEAFYLTKDIEKYGSGYIRVRKEIKDYPTMQFDYKEIANGFLTELSYQEQKISTTTKEKVGEKVGEKTTKNQQLMLNLMTQNPAITAREMSEKVGISSRKIEDNLKKLKQMGLIHRIGSFKGGHWQVNE